MTSGQGHHTLPSENLGDDHNANSSRTHLIDATAATAAVQFLNNQNAAANAGIDVSTDPRFDSATSFPPYPASQIQFQTNTIAPSPPLSTSPRIPSTPQRADGAGDEELQYQPSPLGGQTGDNLRLRTDIHSGPPPPTDSLNTHVGLSTATRPSALPLQHKTSASSLKPGSRTPSFKTGFYGFGTASAASSTVPSPIISAMGDVTPLPSPLLSGDSPGPWKKLGRRPSHESHYLFPPTADSVLVTANGESVAAALANHAKRKTYAGLSSGDSDTSGKSAENRSLHQHGRNRSTSEYIPDPLQIPKRMTTVSGTHVKPGNGPDGVAPPYEAQMRREPHLSEVRGLTPIEKPPTPPPSESSLPLGDSSASESRRGAARRYEYFEAHGREDKKLRRWRAIKMLGQGTFSRVMLATSQMPTDEDDSRQASGLLTPEPQPRLDRRTLVAVKVCEHGPKGGASEDRVEMSLKRELEIMQSIHHPSLVHLKAWSIESTRAILVLSYCPGGDLFDVASSHRELLSPPLFRRIFAELVGAVRYLHERRIVHRDIKLENVLVNLPPSEFADTSIDWTTYPYSVATLTDLGLSRRVADDERLETRCGSDDYAAPEVIMGQPYDGRAIDAWSLGVLLYALLEGRLPFDPNPGVSDAPRMRSRTSHRIARVEWRWIEYAGDDGDHEGDVQKFKDRGLLGAMDITEGLLKRARSRWTMDKIAGMDWVRNAIAVEGGVKFREEEEGEEVL